ncbi:sigma 54-interacting transcriptional regulator [Sporomusa sphaeroides]|uniref:sigma 54-interacting transcriptional regulator n=1 Tax=Sporomusa sphaeroides TaxID=47679 RepID=UPI002B686E7B|nr:sigma 54-interacting transcriptional regulator [Sporomusa sphaeroides]HML33077.1 sigma 54-interacting transcriptional regulator [Sporomusa sphaeroides]
MGKILFFLPKPEDREVASELFADINDGNWELELRHVTGANAVLPFCNETCQADAIIARGVTAAAVKLSAGDVPVVDLSVTGYDIIDAVVECSTRYQTRNIGLVGAQSMIFGGKKIEKFMKVTITPVAVDKEDDAELKIKELKAAGITAMIGGGMSVQLGAKLGMNTVFIPSGPEAIYQAMREATRVATVRRIEQERTEQLRAILDYSVEGIVAVDKDGQLSLMNKAAAKLSSLAENVTGRPAEEVIPQLQFKSVIDGGKAKLGYFQTIGKLPMVINCVPIKINDQIAGAVATFQPVTMIQEVEGDFRRKLHQKGLVAKLTFNHILAESEIMRKTVALAKEYSAVDSNVLIVGETGTGKEIFAQSIHNASVRKQGPFVPVNCAALPENLLESELFGYTEGAFTGAVKGGKMGLFEQAHKGTIFLDEISEISPRIQGQLLRVLQEREIRRLGDDRVIPVDVRVIAATNRGLRQLSREGRFRSDLYYRLDVLQLSIPPLCERTEDILLLLRYFMEQYASRFNRPCTELSVEAQELLLGYSWPGNVRELCNIAERLIVINKNTAAVIQAGHMQAILAATTEVATGHNSRAVKTATIQGLKQEADLERIQQALLETNFNIGKTAQILGLSRTTLWRRVKLLNLVR